MITTFKKYIKHYLISVVVVLGLEGSALDVRTVRSRDGGGLFAAVVIDFDQVLHGFAIREGAKALHFDAGLVNEYIGGAILWLNETESLHGVEPFYGSFLNAIGSSTGQETCARPEGSRGVRGEGCGRAEAAQYKANEGEEVACGESHRC